MDSEVKVMPSASPVTTPMTKVPVAKVVTPPKSIVVMAIRVVDAYCMTCL